MKKLLKRYLKNTVDQDLAERMVFVGGPRQVGKTTFTLTFPSTPSERHPAYLNWDDSAIRSSLLKGQLPGSRQRIVLDEIHKFARWRNLVKGFYDTNKSTVSAYLLTVLPKSGPLKKNRNFTCGTGLYCPNQGRALRILWPPIC